MRTDSTYQTRRTALSEMDKADRRVKQAILLAAALETALLGAFFYVMDFDSRQDWLLLISALLVYATLSASLLALGLRVRLGVLQVLQAIELLAPEED